MVWTGMALHMLTSHRAQAIPASRDRQQPRGLTASACVLGVRQARSRLSDSVPVAVVDKEKQRLMQPGG